MCIRDRAEYVAELIEELSDQKVFLEGTNKLLRFPEYRDLHKAQAVSYTHLGGEVMADVDRDSEHFNQEDLMKAAWGGKLDD